MTLPEFVAAMLGKFPPIRGGLFITDPCVAMEEVELDRAGEEGRMLTNEAVAGGDGAANEAAELRC